MRLYDYAASGNRFKVRLLLGLLGREYERVPVDIFAGDTLTDAFATLNPLRETPVLELDDGRRLTTPRSHAAFDGRTPGAASVAGMSETPTIYAWAGGREALERWLNVFYDLLEEDAELVAMFGGRVSEQHRDHVTTWWCEVMGGPADYTADLGGYEHMLAQHHGLAITDEQRLRFVTMLSRAADVAQLPSDPEFRAALMGYAEWGTRLALHNSQPGAAVAEHAPVPRWGWGVAPPYTPEG